MPNVMMCGYQQEEVAPLKDMIKAVLRDLNLAKDAVISVVPMQAEYADGRPGPYLRICSTDPAEIEAIIKSLKEVSAAVDVEYLVMSGFVPANEMS